MRYEKYIGINFIFNVTKNIKKTSNLANVYRLRVRTTTKEQRCKRCYSFVIFQLPEDKGKFTANYAL